MASSAFTINGSTSPVIVAETTSVALAVTSVTGVRLIEWTLVGRSDSVSATPVITTAGNPGGQTATFNIGAEPVGGFGVSFVVQCRINGGVDDEGHTVASYTTTGIVGVANANGYLPLATGESLARDAVVGIYSDLNAQLASGGGGGGTPSFPIPSVPVIASSSATSRDSSFGRPSVSYAEYIAAHPSGLNGPGAILIAPGLYGTNISVPQGPQRLVSLAAQSPRPGGGGAAGDVSARWAKFSTVTTHINLSGDDSDGAEFVGIYAATAFVNSGAYGNLGILNLVDCGSPLVTFTDGPVYIDGGGGFALGTIDCASLVCNGRNAAPNLDTGFTVTSAQAILASDQVLEVTFVDEAYNFSFKNCKVVFNATNFCISDDGSHKLVMDENTRRYSFGSNSKHFADLDDSGTTLTNFDLGSTCDNGGLASPLTNHACTDWNIGCNASPVRINSIKRPNCPGAFPAQGTGINRTGQAVTMTHQHAGSTAEYRITTDSGSDLVISSGGRFGWSYDEVGLRWSFWTIVTGD